MVAEMWVEMLRDAGIAAMVRPSDTASYLGVAGFGVRVQVQDEDLDRAHELIPEDEKPPSS
jgi:hypothetical protein